MSSNRDHDRGPKRRLALRSFLTVVAYSAFSSSPSNASSPANDALTTRTAAIRDSITKGNYQAAERDARELLEQTEKQHGGGALETAQVLDVLVTALCHSRSQSMSDILPLADRALRIKERELGEKNPALVPSLTNLGVVYRDLDRFADARRTLERALRIQEAASGAKDPALSSTLQALGSVLAAMGAYPEAKILYERDLAIASTASPPDDRGLGQRRYNFARLLSRMGDYEGARSQYERALDLVVKNEGPEQVGTAYILNGLGTVLEELGEYGDARLRIETAYRIATERLGPRHVLTASCVNNLGRLSLQMGDRKSARRFYETALEIHTQSDGPDHSRTAWAKARLADLEYEEGNYDRALELNEVTLPILEKTRGPEHPEIATRLWRYALVLQKVEREAEAETALERALRITEAAVGATHHDEATYLAALGSVARQRGRLADAKSRYEKAVEIFEQSLSPEHPQLAPILAEFASVLEALGDAERAIEVAVRSESIAREHVRRTIRSMPEREALGYWAVAGGGLDVALSVAVRGAGDETRRRAFDAAIASRALVLDEMATRQALLNRTRDAKTTVLARDLARANHALTKQILQGPGAEDLSHYTQKMDLARAAKEEAERALARRSVVFRKQQSLERVGLAQISRDLPRGSVLLSYFHYQRQPQRSGEDSAPLSSLAAFLLRSGEKSPKAFDLGSQAEISALVATCLDEMRRTDASAAAEVEYGRAGDALRRRVWDPIESYLAGAKLVLLVPDGDLNLVNFAALPHGEGMYLIDRETRIHYLAAERDIVATGPTSTPNAALVAVGGCDFDAAPMFASARAGPGSSDPRESALRGAESKCASLSDVRFPFLAGTSDEAKRLSELWTRTHSPKSPATLLMGADASESNIRSAAPGTRVCHFATHGFFLGGECLLEESSRRGTGGLATGAALDSPGQLHDDPLLYTGLALAGANNRAAATGAEDDGILTAQEVAAMNFQGTEWAVLSACGTGLGEVRSGEGVFGLRRAFQVAGARSVIMSLWSVRDQETREWMIRLYSRRLEDHMDTASSVWAANRDVLRQRRVANQNTHPFYWAGFVAAGDWR